MAIFQSLNLTFIQKLSIFTLWNKEYPVNLLYADISDLDAYLDKLNDATHYFLTIGNEDIIGWAFTFRRDGEKWFAIIIDSSVQGQGYGSMMLDKLKAQEIQLNGWVTDHDKYHKADGTPYRSPLAFYLKNGFEMVPDIRLETDKLSAVKIIFKNTLIAAKEQAGA